EDYLGLRGLKWLGKKKWREGGARAGGRLTVAGGGGYGVLGGGEAKPVQEPPPPPPPGSHPHALTGGLPPSGEPKAHAAQPAAPPAPTAEEKPKQDGNVQPARGKGKA